MRILVFMLILCITIGCANMTALTGGVKDSQPPEIDTLKAVPANFTTNFSSKTILLEFDEYIKLKNPSTSLQVNPQLEELPTLTVKGKRIFIELNEDLKPNQTYTFSLNNCIADITEGNLLKNFSYVLSTGSFIDSLSFSGVVFNAENKAPLESVLVGLYDSESSDSIVFNHKPIYSALTDKKGEFQFRNLNEGPFMLRALSDENGNYLFDPLLESIGFEAEEIMPEFKDTSSQKIELALFKSEDTLLRIVSKTGYKNKLVGVKFNKPISNIDYRWEDSNEVNEEIVYWTNDSILSTVNNEKITTSTLYVDLENNGITDTVRIPLNKNIPLFTPVKINLAQSSEVPLEVKFSAGISSFFEEEIILSKDSVKLPFSLFLYGPDSGTLSLEAQLDPNTEYKLYFKDSSLISDSKQVLDSCIVTINTYKEDYFGSLIVNYLQKGQLPYFLQLLDLKGNVVKQSKLQNGGFTVEFLNVLPAKYLLRIIQDDNKNEKWDTGSYPSRQPEEVSNHDFVINVRSNWQVEVTFGMP